MAEPKKNMAAVENPKTCFVIMPISDPDGYAKGHFKHVFEDIIDPGCAKAGFSAIRADQVKQSNLIHLDILQKLLEAPMAVCDLSSRNPNVLFELALRQAFDKPVALVQEVGTPQVFDISPIRCTEYRKERVYHEVLQDQDAVAAAIKETFDAHESGKGVNSIVKLLALGKAAQLPTMSAPEAKEDVQQLILAELANLRREVTSSRRETTMRSMTRGLFRRPPVSFDDSLRELMGRIEQASSLSETSTLEGLLVQLDREYSRMAHEGARDVAGNVLDPRYVEMALRRCVEELHMKKTALVGMSIPGDTTTDS